MEKGILVAVFPTQRALTRALDFMNTLEALIIRRAAVVTKAADGQTVILDDDLSADEGGIAGGTLGAAMAAFGMVQLGALALPGVGTVIAIGAGALVGGLVGNVTGRFAATLLDFGFRNDQIEALSDRLQEGHPALVIEVDNPQDALSLLQEKLTAFRAEWIEPLERAAHPPAEPPTD